MRRILIFDEDTPQREALVAQLRHTVHADVVLASDAADVVAGIGKDVCAAVLVDTQLAGDGLASILTAVQTASWRPLVVLVAAAPKQDLDPDLISLIVRKPYEVGMVSGILLAAISDGPPVPAAGDSANLPC